MEALEIIKRTHLLFNKEPLNDNDALKVFKGLPSEFNEIILSADWVAFEAKLKNHYVYLGLTAEEILQADRNIIGKIIKEQMIQNKESYAQLGRILNISQSLIYEFVERNASMNLLHLQKILHHYGLAIAVATRDLITDKYYIINEGNPPTDDELTGPFGSTEDTEGCVDCEDEEDIQVPTEEVPPTTETPVESEEQKDPSPVDPEGEGDGQQGTDEKDPIGTVPSTEEGNSGLQSDNDGDSTKTEPLPEETVPEVVQPENTGGQNSNTVSEDSKQLENI